MEDLTNRFLEAYEYLKAAGEVSGYSDFAKKLGISNSMMTEISKGRTNPGVKAIQNIVKIFGVDANWLAAEIGNIKLQNYPDLDDTPVAILEEPSVSGIKNDKKLSATLSPTLSPTDKFNTPAVITINENNNEVITIVPAKAAAGYLNGYADPEYIETLPTIRLPGYSRATHRGFEVKGHSMGNIHHGAIAVGKWEENFDCIRDRRIYILVTKDDGIVMKRVLNRISSSGKLVLISDNQNKRDYPNYSIDPENVLEVWNLRTALINNFPEPGELYNRFNDIEAKVTLLEEKYRQLGGR